MAKSLVDTRDSRFVLFEQLEVDKLSFEGVTKKMLEMTLKEAEKLAQNVIAPTNSDADKIGCKYEDGKVIVPESFHKPYEVISEGGWNVISDDVEVGGQGLPKSIEICCRELFEAANMGFSNFINLTHGSAKLVEIFGTDEQKETYLEKMFEGTWAGTMCITEAEAGSDVGAIATTATKKEDGTYSIKGGKIFISGGDNDLVENIVHMVLARIEGHPEGTKGLSLFIVPNIRPSDGEFNDVHCTGIEEKMGLHGSCTCSLTFGDKDNCTGYLIGKEQQGIMVMFHMMNEARQLTGSQGLAVASAAYLEALEYARQRIQGVHYTQSRNPEAENIAIADHPDIRAKLMKMKSYVEGCRALVYYHAFCMDQLEKSKSDEEKAKWNGLVALLTPICKAYSTDRGFDVCSDAVQTLGGYGYCSEFPVEQYLRDEMITRIYEGTNGIQAIDLVTRKIGMGKGSVFKSFLAEIENTIAKVKENSSLSEYASKMVQYRDILEDATNFMFTEMRSENIGIAMAKATKFLELFGDITLAWLWVWQVALAEEKLEELMKKKGKTREEFDPAAPVNKDAAYYGGKIMTGKYYLERMMPSVTGKLEEVKSGGENFLDMALDSF